MAKEPHRSRPPAPHTLDDWMRAYQREGLTVFLRAVHSSPPAPADLRRAAISRAAIEWLNTQWREYTSPRHLYQALREQAELYGWTIPSESWLYRQWQNLAEIARAYYIEGAASYEARDAPYVPRDFTDLEALQVLCGDHSERDILVRLPDGTLQRPWLTLWLDLRTGLLWGWHLSLVPSAQTAALAYASGVETFGAQPLSRRDDDFQSYVYTDRGRDYLSHNWDGRVLAVHERAMQLDGGLELICHQRRVGILDDLSLRHLIARGRNPKEKPVERLFKDLTTWEENNFAEFCGRHPTNRPDRCRRLYEQHERLSLEVTEHWAQTKRCDQCGERTKARFPSDVKAPVQYGQRVRAVATYLHQYQLLPFARTSEAMRDLFASSISPGTIHTTRHCAAAKLVGVEEQIKHAIKDAAVIGAYETGLRVAGTGGWVHVARTDGLTHYGYDARRSKAAVDAIGILPTFTGTCVRDGWFIYDEYGGATHALCNVHLLRELVYVEEVCAEQQQWTRPLSKLLLDIKAAVEQAKAQGETKLSDEQLTTYRARYDRLVKRAARLNQPPKKEKPDALAKRFKVVKVKRRDPAAPLIRRLQTKRDQILRFMTDFQVPFDNNGAERDIRMVKLYQKISGCFRTPEGAQAFCRIRSYLSSARKQGHSPLVALERTFAGQPLALDTS